MGNIDKRNRLNEQVFGYRVTKDNIVFIDWHGKLVKIVKGKEAQKLLSQIKQSSDDKEEQLILAKLTGNFKRGNER